MIKVYQIPSKVMKENNIFSFMYGDNDLFNVMDNIQHYKHVANLHVDSLNEAFEVGNIGHTGPEEKYSRFAKMRSVSVGDILITESGSTYVVADFGFDLIEPQFMLAVEEQYEEVA